MAVGCCGFDSKLQCCITTEKCDSSTEFQPKYVLYLYCLGVLVTITINVLFPFVSLKFTYFSGTGLKTDCLGSYMRLTVDKSLAFGSLVEFDVVSKLPAISYIAKQDCHLYSCFNFVLFFLFRWLPN